MRKNPVLHPPHYPTTAPIERAYLDPFAQHYFQFDLYRIDQCNPTAPQLTLELPSDNESSRRPSGVSLSQFSQFSISPASSLKQLPQGNFLSTTNSRSTRRKSFSCTIAPTPSSYQQHVLEVPQGRSRGGSMPGSVSADDIYRLRNFSTSGKRIINKGDSILSRSNISINSISSR